MKTKEKGQRRITNANLSKVDQPRVDMAIYIRRKKPRKTDPLYDKITVTQQEGGKIFGVTDKGRPTTAHLRKAKCRNISE